MFGRPSKESASPDSPGTPQDTTAVPPPMATHATRVESENKLTQKTDLTSPEIVGVAEKISGIVSPYFIVIVGLLLYEENFLVGIILILSGILSLLKISWKDIGDFLGNIKNSLGLDDKNPL